MSILAWTGRAPLTRRRSDQRSGARRGEVEWQIAVVGVAAGAVACTRMRSLSRVTVMSKKLQQPCSSWASSRTRASVVLSPAKCRTHAAVRRLFASGQRVGGEVVPGGLSLACTLLVERAGGAAVVDRITRRVSLDEHADAYRHNRTADVKTVIDVIDAPDRHAEEVDG